MGLRSSVFAGPIMGLSDARYFSGMGVRWLSIQVSDKEVAYMPSDRFREIAGWISGPEFVLDVSALESVDFNLLSQEYGIRLFCIAPQQADDAIGAGVRFGLSLPPDSSVDSLESGAEWVITRDPDRVQSGCQRLYIGDWNPESAQACLQLDPRAGFVIPGSMETRPGIAQLTSADFLEWLEED